MLKPLFKWLPMAILTALSIVLLFVIFKNQKDPYWNQLDVLLVKDYKTVANSRDSIEKIFNSFHNSNLKMSDSLLTKLIAKPFMPTMEVEKLKEYLDIFKDKRSCMFSAVTGSGNTTLVDRIANIIALKPENKKVILCAPQFDLEYNKKYIGHIENGQLQKGELLQFWDKCSEHPEEKFVCVMDNIDKMNPETVFGPELWQHLDDPKAKTVLGQDTIIVPSNFYLICIVQSGVGQKIELTNEHYRRLGGMVLLPIHPNELILFLRGKRQEVIKDLNLKRKALAENAQSVQLKDDILKLEEQLTALTDTFQVKKFVYFFAKSNEMIVSKYSYGHQLGQWSDIRKYFMPKDFDKVNKTFISHVNAYRPNKELKIGDFDDIMYVINNEGFIPNTSPFWRATRTLTDLGLASELGVAGTFAIISGIFGWFYFRKRHRYIKEFTEHIYTLMHAYENNNKSSDEILKEINLMKREFDALVLDQKVNYNEASFFYGFLEDKTRYIEIAREINESFLKLMDAFLDDNILTDTEYSKLNQFLNSIRYRISTYQYLFYKEEIEKAYQKYGVANMGLNKD